MGLGHAFEIDPDLPESFVLEVAQAQMAREIFPESPLKYMPPTKFMTGDIFKGYAVNAMFNFAGKLTGQSIQLLGMLTEAIHTPFMQDRYLAIANARYVMGAMAGLAEEVEFKKNGAVVRRARETLDRALALLGGVAKSGLFAAIEAGEFADVKRRPDGGKGLDGVAEKAGDYWNPAGEFLRTSLGLEA
jgi:beta-lysine 5,6-aminomutase alpha subunit